MFPSGEDQSLQKIYGTLKKINEVLEQKGEQSEYIFSEINPETKRIDNNPKMSLQISSFMEKILLLNSANISDKEVFKLSEFLAFANQTNFGFILYTHFNFYLKKQFKPS
jgi:hypothetical protein